MTTRRRRVERRLFDAVLLVLASTGCERPIERSSTGPQPPPPPPAPVLDAAVVVTAPIDAGTADAAAIVTAPADAAMPVVAAGKPSPPQADMDALCATRKQQKLSATKVPKDKHTVSRAYERAMWDPQRGIVNCWIVRETKPGTVTVSHVPRCCPSPDPRFNTQCPPAHDIQVDGTMALFEQAELDPKGKLLKSTVKWVITHADLPREPMCGRRPEGLHFDGAPCPDSTDIGAALAHMAELELASVPAFERLAEELALHGAPAALIRGARAAARDEIRHARMMTALAGRYGATPRAVAVPVLSPRTLVEIARENAVEGCVREAYGALTATYQAEAAPPELRATFAAIARDERRHAALAEAVDAWIQARLADDARDAIEIARVDAMNSLRDSLVTSPPLAALGIPGGADALALFDAYFA